MTSPNRRIATTLLTMALGGAILSPVVSTAQQPRHSSPSAPSAATSARSAPLPERAVRRDIPLPTIVRRALAAGTRDSSGRPGPRYWQLWTDYTITARLEPKTSTLSGRETVVIHNPSDAAISGIVLRLDQNISRPDAARWAATIAGLTDGMKITKLAVDGQAIDVAKAQLASTVAHIPGNVPARGRATLDVEWSFQVPIRAPRMGRWDDTLYQIAQWYPRVMVYDDLRGWNTEPYLGGSEFFNNFGRFDVTLDVPAGWLVGATGVLRNPEQVLTPTARQRLAEVLTSDSARTIVGATERGPGQATAAGDRLQWHFVADTVGDFAWATSDRYVWNATRATIPGKGPIPVHMFYLASHAQDFADWAGTVRHALQFYSALWMPYAFPQLTMVDGPEQGMEYPMFIMSSVGAADHEAGHQWWPMMVGNNETWYGWMDEGFNDYMNFFSDAAREGQHRSLDGSGQSYGRYTGDPSEPPMMWNANYAGPSYVFTTYGKAPRMLAMLGGIVGDSAVQRAMSAYAHAWRFKHPSPWDFMFIMNKELKQDLGWFWYAWLFTTESVDGRIQDVRTTGRRTTVTVRQDGGMPSPVVLELRFAPTGPAITLPANARKVDSVTAVVTYPVDVWFDGRRTFAATFDVGGRRIERVTLDPARRFPDRDPSDNVWPRSAPAGTPGH